MDITFDASVFIIFSFVICPRCSVFAKQAYKFIVLQKSRDWPTNNFPCIYLNVYLIEKFSVKFVELNSIFSATKCTN